MNNTALNPTLIKTKFYRVTTNNGIRTNYRVQMFVDFDNIESDDVIVIQITMLIDSEDKALFVKLLHLGYKVGRIIKNGHIYMIHTAGYKQETLRLIMNDFELNLNLDVE